MPLSGDPTYTPTAPNLGPPQPLPAPKLLGVQPPGLASVKPPPVPPGTFGSNPASPLPPSRLALPMTAIAPLPLPSEQKQTPPRFLFHNSVLDEDGEPFTASYVPDLEGRAPSLGSLATLHEVQPLLGSATPMPTLGRTQGATPAANPDGNDYQRGYGKLGYQPGSHVPPPPASKSSGTGGGGSGQDSSSSSGPSSAAPDPGDTYSLDKSHQPSGSPSTAEPRKPLGIPVSTSVEHGVGETHYLVRTPDGHLALATLKSTLKVTGGFSEHPKVDVSPHGVSFTDGPLSVHDPVATTLVERFAAAGFPHVEASFTQRYPYRPEASASGKSVRAMPVPELHVSIDPFPPPTTTISVSTRVKVGKANIELEYSVSLSVQQLGRPPRVPVPELTKKTAPWLVAAVVAALIAAAAETPRPTRA